MGTTSFAIEERSTTFNSVWQGYGALEARFAKASTILFFGSRYL